MRARRVVPLLMTGAALALVESVLVLLVARDLFLSFVELLRYVRVAVPLLALTTLLVGALCGTLLQRLQTSPRRLHAAVMLAVGASLVVVLWLLTEGRRVRELPGRPVIVVALALLGGFVASRMLSALRGLVEAGRAKWVLALCVLAAVAAMTLDTLVLRRLYPAFHWSLTAVAVVAAAAASAFVKLPPPSPTSRSAASRVARLAQRAPLAGGACALWAVFEVLAIRGAPNARFAIDQAAPLTGKLLSFVPVPSPVVAPAAAAALPSAGGADTASPQGVGLDLRGSDVLLVSIDALRADRVESATRRDGVPGPAPQLERLARESVVFDRAYTPTPHTSYALASTMTGKYLRPLMALSGELSQHPTLARMLRRHGYRTAAFYPPAVFFVDEHRFAGLAKARFGFEYTKAMFATAEQRVAQLEAYLALASSDHPLFVWVHLFEPHEPYEPPERFARGDTPLQRYDGEVAAADEAVGRLVETFRAARPGATVIVTADHGEEFGEHGGGHHGTTLFDEQVRVPLLWSSPGAVRPAHVSAPVETIDIVTTLLSALGIPRDVRMRGDDLTPLLAGGEAPAGMRAFASLDDLHMVTDGKLKAICAHGGTECRLFDLEQDPGERRDIGQARPDALAALVADLSRFQGSIAEAEALAMEGGAGWPEALARATLGDARAAPDVMPLLSSPRVEVRRAAARALGELRHGPARAALARLRGDDPDPEVRGEAAVAGLALGDASAVAPLRVLLSDPVLPPGLSRRAALALAARGDGAGCAVLRETAGDAASEEGERVAAIAALGRVGGAGDVAALCALFDDVRLRPHAARALGILGEARASASLLGALSVERYPEARSAEARALLALGQPRAMARQVERFLGTESSLPDGVALLLEADALRGRGWVLADAPALREGSWSCAPTGCLPGEGATLHLPTRAATRKKARLVLRVHAEAGAAISLTDAPMHDLPVGSSELGLTLEPTRGPRQLPVTVQGNARIQAVVLVPTRPDIPPPPPEPWSPDAGIGEEGTGEGEGEVPGR